MTRNDINKYLCGILSTLSVVDYAPESSVYIAMGMNLENWETIKHILIRGGLGYLTATWTAPRNAIAQHDRRSPGRKATGDRWP